MVHVCLNTNSSWKMHVIKYSPSRNKSKSLGQQLLSFSPLVVSDPACCVRWAPSHQAPWFLSFPSFKLCQLGLPGFPGELLCLLALSVQPSLLAHMFPSQLLLLNASWRVCAGCVWGCVGPGSSYCRWENPRCMPEMACCRSCSQAFFAID